VFFFPQMRGVEENKVPMDLKVKENKRHGMDNGCTQKSREFKGTSFSNLIKETSINYAIKILEYYLSLLAIHITMTLYYLSP